MEKEGSKSQEDHTPTVMSFSPIGFLFFAPTRASIGSDPSRSGYEAAEYRQNGADAPIFSLLNAIYLEIRPSLDELVCFTQYHYTA